MKTAAAYIRVSTEEQAQYSPDSQLKMIRNYADKNAMTIPKDCIFIDEGISGRNAKKRPEFMRMMRMAKEKPPRFGVILVYALSRFARNREDSVVYKKMLRKELGIELISITQDFGNDKTSILLEALLEAMDEYYSVDLAENVKRGMIEKISRGEPVSIPSFGYQMQGNRYVIREEEADIVRKIFDDYLQGVGCRDLAVKLNHMGVRTHRGNLFESRTIAYMLKNPIYIGTIKWNPGGKTTRIGQDDSVILVENCHDPIIDRETFEKVQEKIKQNQKMYRKFSRQSNNLPDFMLRGLLKCSNCGATLVRCNERSLQCSAYKKGKCECSHSIAIGKANAMVLFCVEKTIQEGNFILKPKHRSAKETEQTFYVKQIEKENQKLRRSKEAYLAGIDTIEEYKLEKEKIVSRIRELKTEYNHYRNQPAKKNLPARVDQNFIDCLKRPEVSETEKNKILRCFIQKIVINTKDRTINFYFYE